jgi:hypothetical protein
MSPYRFTLQKDDTRIEELGAMALADDREALAFGRGIARDLAGDPGQQEGVAVAVINGTRIVRTIPLVAERQSRSRL